MESTKRVCVGGDGILSENYAILKPYYIMSLNLHPHLLLSVFQKRKIRPTTVRVMSAVLSILIGCLIFLAVPTVVFQKVEKWSFLESLYFVVITLTTVGFGDFVPGANLHTHVL